MTITGAAWRRARGVWKSALVALLLGVPVASCSDGDDPATGGPGTLDPGLGKSIIDAHVHIAGLGYGDSGCFINDTMRDNYRFPIYLWAMGVTIEELEEQGDRVLLGKLSVRIEDSRTVDKAVILALDGYVTGDGVLDRERTQAYVPNEYVARETARYDNLLYGASINPNRPDAVSRLRQADRDGAVVVKWIPSIMNIDAADPRHEPFYREMARLGIPLLIHTGMEKSFAGADDTLGEPERLRAPLDAGVTVIAAHIAATGQTDGVDNFDLLLPLLREYENLLVDISSLTQVNRLNYLVRALAVAGLSDRMIYGSDWPLQFFPLISPWYHINNITFADAWAVSSIDNGADRDVALKVALGVPAAVFQRTGELLAARINRRIAEPE